jgi:hypothetical protein
VTPRNVEIGNDSPPYSDRMELANVFISEGCYRVVRIRRDSELFRLYETRQVGQVMGTHQVLQIRWDSPS